MKAAICYEFGKPLIIEDVILDPPQYGEVKIRLVATAICHSDIHAIRGEWGGDIPVIAGHESAGVVEEIGDGVTLVKVGDPVIVSLLRSCGRCKYCLTGKPNHCDGIFALSTEHRIRNQKGDIIQQGINVAGFAEYTVVDQSQLVRIPKAINLENAALLACGVITGYGAAVNTGQVTAGSTVTVIGAGGVGLNAIQGAAIAGAKKIIAVDLLDSKLESARKFGATHIVNANNTSPIEAIQSLTEGNGADFAIVTVGSSIAINQSFDLVNKAGTIVIAGLPPLDEKVTLPTFMFVVTGKRLLGSSMGSTRLQVDVPILIDQYQSGKLLLDELITKRYSLDQINEAIESTERGEALRNLIVF